MQTGNTGALRFLWLCFGIGRERQRGQTDKALKGGGGSLFQLSGTRTTINACTSSFRTLNQTILASTHSCNADFLLRSRLRLSQRSGRCMFLVVVVDDNEVLEDVTLTRSFCCVVFRFRSLFIF